MMFTKLKFFCSTALFFMIISTSFAQGNADVISAKAKSTGDGIWHFSVTIEHPDTGWKDYADGWDVVLPDGRVVKPNAGEEFTRTLWHPHVGEQPFTRTQGNIEIPAFINEVKVRAHDLRDGFGGAEVNVKLN